MNRKLPIAEVLTPELLAECREHILDFLAMEGITPDPTDLGATELSDRQIKQLLAELAGEA